MTGADEFHEYLKGLQAQEILEFIRFLKQRLAILTNESGTISSDSSIINTDTEGFNKVERKRKNKKHRSDKSGSNPLVDAHNSNKSNVNTVPRENNVNSASHDSGTPLNATSASDPVPYINNNLAINSVNSVSNVISSHISPSVDPGIDPSTNINNVINNNPTFDTQSNPQAGDRPRETTTTSLEHMFLTNSVYINSLRSTLADDDVLMDTSDSTPVLPPESYTQNDVQSAPGPSAQRANAPSNDGAGVSGVPPSPIADTLAMPPPSGTFPRQPAAMTTLSNNNNTTPQLSPTTQPDGAPNTSVVPKIKDRRGPPPIILRDRTKWRQTYAIMQRLQTKIKYNRYIPDGIKIQTVDSDDFRNLIQELKIHDIYYHAHPLPEDKCLKVVLRGIPPEITIDEIRSELTQLNIIPTQVIRMNKGPEKTPMPLVLVTLEKKYRKIYDIEFLCHLKIVVEPLLNTKSSGMCHRCQLFGHAQSYCNAPFKCVKCAEGHPSKECPRAKSEPSTCANCHGPHPANFPGCPKNPANRQPAPIPATNVWEQRRNKLINSTPPNAPPANNTNNKLPPNANNNSPGGSPCKMAEFTKTLGEMCINFSKGCRSDSDSVAFMKNTQKLLALVSPNV